ncbi:MAG: hypothetical protein AB8F95_06300 [Bacteroidia bacterium]
MKRKLLYFAFFILVLYLGRGMLFRALVSYQTTGERAVRSMTDIDIKETNLPTDQSLSFVADKLSFYTGPCNPDPNVSIQTGQANCVGYAAMYASLMAAHPDYKVKHCVGKIYVLGMDVHQLFDHPFFHDHDFNQIIYRTTGKIMLVDPSVYDMLGVVEVRAK